LKLGSLFSNPNSDFYAYFTPIREYMPQNCSSDVQAVIAYLDGMFKVNDTAGIQTLKEAFGLGDVVHVTDFASARESSLSLIQFYVVA
jgi:hypothetical protein